jgi:Tol biopolymer transport system component
MSVSPRLCLLLLAACGTDAAQRVNDRTPAAIPPRPLVLAAGKPVPPLDGEPRLRNVRQLTFGGQNAEGYFSSDGSRLVYQSQRPPYECDQIFLLDLETGAERLLSTGKGRTTCAYFLQGNQRVLYASTHLADEKCPPPVMRVQGKYVWAVYPGYDIFSCKPDGSDLVRLTSAPGYDAEATVCPVSGRVVFTSARDHDLEIYSMEPDGSDVQRLTDRVGYDGGAFYSHDGKKIVLRSGFPADAAAIQEYRDFLAKGVVVPTAMEITVMDRDGRNFRQLTRNGKANFAPYWLPDCKRIIFASNMADPRGRDFELYVIDSAGGEPVRITNNPTFDGFPMFSPDGKWLVFASNRYGKEPGETNLFLAEWVESGG